MASIYQRKKDAQGKPTGKYWAKFYVKDSSGQLRTIRRSTGQTSQTKAKQAAAEMERAAQGVAKAGSDKAAAAKAIFAEVVAQIERETFTIIKAREAMNRLLRLASGQELKALTAKEWMDEWLRRKARDTSAASMARYRASVKSFLDYIGPDRAAKPLEAVTKDDIRLWREKLQDEGRTGKTVNKYQKDINAAFRVALRESLIATNPAAGVDLLSTDDSTERKPFTAEEVKALVEHAPSNEWKGLILVAAYTGLRLGDAARLSWKDVDLPGGKIVVMPSKTKRKKRIVTIPIHPSLREWLQAAPIADDAPGAHVFPSLSKLPVHSNTGLSNTFTNEVMRIAGVDRGKPSRDPQSRGAGRVIWERGFHSLRHATATWLRAAGVPEEDRMAILGQTSREVHAGYAKADDAALKTAIEKLSPIEQGAAKEAPTASP